MKKNLFILIGLFCALYGFSQNGYGLQSGETIKVDLNGNVLQTSVPTDQTSKINNGAAIQSTVIDMNSMYNNDGTFKIPGFTPTGNAELDEELYKKAKYLLYQNNHEEYSRIFEKQAEYKYSVTITYEEFMTFPDNKKQSILEHPEKFYIEMSNELHDCNK